MPPSVREAFNRAKEVGIANRLRPGTLGVPGEAQEVFEVKLDIAALESAYRS
jgi:hypothetical protein